MSEIYKGHRIVTSWNYKKMGFDYCVKVNGTEVAHSPEAYFYEENAVKAAKEVVDKLIEEDSEGADDNKGMDEGQQD